jgi:hypothetical protein
MDTYGTHESNKTERGKKLFRKLKKNCVRVIAFFGEERGKGPHYHRQSEVSAAHGHAREMTASIYSEDK